MASVAVNPPKTPVTKGSNGMATATLPNICKMPPPPPPFCPTPLPNIGMSGKNPQKYTTTVKVEGQYVAIQGASFDSVGDIASKATGGGVVSSNAEGPTKFIALGAIDTKFEGKDVQFLGDQMLNNCGPAGSPANSATMAGEIQAFVVVVTERLQELVNECDKEVNEKWKKDGKNPDDCWASTGKVDSNGEPVTVQQQLGREKEDCVYDKMYEKHDKKPPAPLPGKGKFEGCSVSAQQRFMPDGQPFMGGSMKGTIVPDIIMQGPDGAVAAVRDLKFPCPSSAKKRGRWSEGQREKYQKAFDVIPELIFPK